MRNFELTCFKYIKIKDEVYETEFWVFATNSDCLVTISLQPNVVDFRCFKL